MAHITDVGILYVRTGNGGADAAFTIPDLGIVVPTGASWTLLAASSPSDADGNSGQFTSREIRDSSDLTAAIVAGDLEWSIDGSTAEDGADYVADWMVMQDFSDDFLNLRGGGLAIPTGTTVPASGLEGQIFWDSDDEGLWLYDPHNSGWNLIATSSGVQNNHGNLEGLGDDDHSQYLLLSGNAARNAVTGSVDMSGGDYFRLPQAADVSTSFPAGSEGALAWDTDDDTLYAHDGTQWFAIAPASGIISDHGGLTGLSDDDHTQYLNETRHDALPADNPHSVTFTQAVTADGGTDITAAEAETLTDGSNADLLHGHTSSGLSLDHGGLVGLADDDHPQYTEWNNTETISGLWTFDTADSDPSFIIDPVASAPTTNLADGGIAVVDDLLYAYDATRSKWLSVDRATFVAGRRGSSTNIYLRVPDTVASSVTGYRMLRDGTITGIFAQTEGAESWTFEVRSGGSVIASLVISAADGNQATNVNVNVSQGDELQFYCNGSAIGSPVGGIEVAWRV